MKYAYVQKLALNAKNKEQLAAINAIVEKYRKQGYRLSLRQLYYQLVTQNVIKNDQKEYAKLSQLLTKGRMAGIVDWDAIEDRLRRPYIPYYVSGLKAAMQDTIDQYRLDRMKGQENYLEIWVEKDALSEVLKRSTGPFHVRVMVNRGYSSTSAMHDAFLRFNSVIDAANEEEESRNVKVTIIYLGDLDPSGEDMTRDIGERIKTFFFGFAREDWGWDEEEFDPWFEEHFEIVKIALTVAQVRQYNPPPNPAKVSDPRATAYIAKFGHNSWEVDALEPSVLHKLVQDNIKARIDADMFNAQVELEEKHKAFLKKAVEKVTEADE